MEWFTYVFNNLLIPLILTIVIELPMVVVAFFKEFRKGLIINIIIINIITNLSLNTILITLCNIVYSIGIWENGGIVLIYSVVGILEIVIPWIEANMYMYCYKTFEIKKVLAICYIVNMVSFITGIKVM